MGEIERLKIRLSHASGALSDIQSIATDCVKSSDAASAAIGEAILNRILCSADMVRNPPRRYCHAWEQMLWEKYLSGELKACASDNPCRMEAEELEAAR